MSKRFNRRHQHLNDTSQNPIERIDSIGKRIQNRAAGYQSALRKYLCELYEISCEIQEDFEQYQELVSSPCFASRPRIRNATEDRFAQYTIEAVLRRAFDGSDVSDSCISKYIGALSHCAAKRIRPTKVAAQMEEWGGVEKTYNRGKASTEPKATSPTADEAVSKPKIDSKSKTSGKQLTATAKSKIFGDDYLHIALERKALKSMLKAKEGDERLLEVRCKGRDEDGYLIWVLIGDDEGYSRGSLDNDNDNIFDAA